MKLSRNYSLHTAVYGTTSLVELSWPQKSQLIEGYFNSSLISESQTTQAKLLIEGIWDKVVSASKWAGGKTIDFVQWTGKQAMKLGKGTLKVLKKIGGSIGDMFVWMIKQLPKGDVILEFIENVLGSMKQKLSELASYMKDKISEWKKSAKKTIIDFFINTLMLSDAFKEDLYSVMGVTEEDVEEAQNEMRNRGINTLNELHIVWEAERLLTEAAGGTYIFENDIEDSLKVLGVLDNPPDGQEGSIDPAEFLRGKAGSVIEFLFDKFAELADKNFLKYMQPLFDSSFFKPFESGYGLAASGFMGILSMGSLSWDGLVKFVEAITKGFQAKEKKAGKAGRAVRFLFTGDGASLLKELVVGIVTGSNLEVIIRALMGDPTQVAEACNRLIGAIMGAVRKAIKDNIRPALQATVGGDAGDEAEGQIGDLMGGYIDDFFDSTS